MSETPNELRYAKTHEWARLEDDGTVTVGISDFAQDALGDVVYVELPEVDAVVEGGEEAGVVESVKAASDIYAPIGGTVVAVNEALEDAPETVNKDPYGDGWFFRIAPNDVADLDELLDADAYSEVCESEEH
jgi:glycine cleavage system H protein